jgi:Siphovirus Gp157
MMHIPDVRRELHRHEYWRDRLLAEFPDADEVTLRDTLSGFTKLDEVLVCLTRSYLDDVDIAAALGIRIGTMEERLRRIEARAEKKRAALASAMEEAGIKTLHQPDFTLSLRAIPPSVVVLDEEVIPEVYWVPKPPKLDKRALGNALREGKIIPGVVLGNGAATISIRIT